MAEEPESRMLFDLRGRRKRVIQVIYVLLAIIMGASLIVIGLPSGSIQNTNQASIDLAEASIERAEDLESRVAASPEKLGARAELIRARTSAGKSLSQIDPQTGQAIVTPEAAAQYDLAADAWDDYLKATKGDPDPAVALLMAQTFSGLSIGGTVARFESNSREAVEAQKIVVVNAEQLFKQGEGPAPTNQLLTLAYYQYLAQDPEAADKSREQALSSVDDKEERKALDEQLSQAEQQGQFIATQLKRARKQAKQDGGKSLQEPAGSLGTQDSLGTGTTGP